MIVYQIMLWTSSISTSAFKSEVQFKKIHLNLHAVNGWVQRNVTSHDLE
jgi:hypothetical protein